MIIAKKLTNFPILHDICPKKINKMPEFYMIFAQKNVFFSEFGEASAPRPPSPTPMICHVLLLFVN